MDAATATAVLMRPAVEGWKEAGCRLTSRQTTMAANIAEREVLMACCQGDTGQPGSVSFADANETSQLLLTLASSGKHKLQPHPPAPQRGALTYTWAEERGNAQLFICFSRLLAVCPLCLSPFGNDRLLIASKCPTTPTLTSYLLVSSPIPLILCVELAFSERGGWGEADSSMCCWITALGRQHSTPATTKRQTPLLRWR